MPIRFIDEQPAEPPKGKIRFWMICRNLKNQEATISSSYGVSMGVVDPIYGVGQLVPRGLSAAAKAIGLTLFQIFISKVQRILIPDTSKFQRNMNLKDKTQKDLIGKVGG